MAKNTAPSTQEHLPIAGIQDGVVIMNDASVRAIIKVEPINFELKSETEQNAIIYSYQAFLNSLEFPVQIVIHSKKLDLERYLLRLEQDKKVVTNELLRIQIEDYVDFVRRLISIANIMSKRFYMIVNYSAVTKGTSISGLFGKKQTGGPLLYQDQFERFRTEAYNRANIVAGALTRIGLKVSFLDTQQLIELFYGVYNPDIVSEERLTNIADLNSNVVSAPDVLSGGQRAAADAVNAAAAALQPTPAVPTPATPAPETPPIQPTLESIGVQPPAPSSAQEQPVTEAVSPAFEPEPEEKAPSNPA